MSKNQKKRQSMMIGFLITLMMISVGFFTGCTNNNMNPADNTPIISDNDLAVLRSAYNEYDMLRQNTSAKNARQQLLQKINTEYEGVKNAHLGIDSYSIFIEYSAGGGAIVDTYESEESNNVTSGVGFMVAGGNSHNDYLSKNTLRFDDFTLEPTDTEYSSRGEDTFGSPYQFSSDEPSGTITPSKKKVLILSPSYYQFPTKPWEDTIELFKAYGWTDEDIVIKVIDRDKSTGGLNGGNILPEDYFNLDDYGIILFAGHGGADKNFNEDNLYLQFCFLSNKTIKENSAIKQELTELYYENKIYFGDFEKGFVGTTPVNWLQTFIRADLLREKIDTALPGSYMYFNTCYGGYFNKIFLDKGANIFLGYEQEVHYSVSYGNMLAMNTLLLEKGYSVHTAFLDDTIISTSIYDPVPVYLMVYPNPNSDPTIDMYYFPAWFDKITVTGIPEDADSIDVTMTSEEGISMKSKSYHVSSSTFTVTDFNDFVFPATVTRTIRVNALDVYKEVIAHGQSTSNLSAGANLKQINLTEEEGNEESKYVEYNNYGINVTITFTVSSNKWETGKEVTATATCTSSDYKGVTGFIFFFHNCNITIVSHNPPFPVNSSTGRIYGSIKNGTLAEIRWSSGSYSGMKVYGSPATFTIRFRLNSRHAGYVSSIQASSLGHEVSEMPSIVFT